MQKVSSKKLLPKEKREKIAALEYKRTIACPKPERRVDR
jgi:hypothetical protein